MKVEIIEFYTDEPSPWGTAKTKCGFDMVMVNGVQGGWVPNDPDDEFYMVFHPLSGFPEALIPDVIANSELKSSLKAPQPAPITDEDD